MKKMTSNEGVNLGRSLGDNILRDKEKMILLNMVFIVHLIVTVKTG